MQRKNENERIKNMGIIGSIIICLLSIGFAVFTKFKAEKEIEELDALYEELSYKLVKAERNKTDLS